MATLIVRPDKIGDLILSTPVIENIKKAYPSEKIYVLCSSYACDVIKSNPYINGIIKYNGSGVKKLYQRLKSLNIEKAISLFPTFSISLAIFLSGVKERAVSGFKWYQWLYNKRTYLRRSKCLKKEWEYNLDLASLIFPKIEKKGEPKLYLKEEEKTWGKERLKDYVKPIIGIFPGGGKEKRWPVSKFYKLCELIEEKLGTPLILWGPNEYELIKEFKKRWIHPELLNLREIMAIIYNLDAFVSNNTGPMHIAASFKKPLVQIFDPRKAVSPRRWGHEYKGAEIVMPEVPTCTKCSRSCQYFDCMERIDVETVWKKLLKCLSEKG